MPIVLYSGTLFLSISEVSSVGFFKEMLKFSVYLDMRKEATFQNLERQRGRASVCCRNCYHDGDEALGPKAKELEALHMVCNFQMWVF